MTEATRSWPTNTRMDGRVELICPEHGCGHPSKELTLRYRHGKRKSGDVIWHDHDGVHGCCRCCEQEGFREAEADHLALWGRHGVPAGRPRPEVDVTLARALVAGEFRNILEDRIQEEEGDCEAGSLDPLALDRGVLERQVACPRGVPTPSLARVCLALLDRVEALEEAAREAGWEAHGWLPKR